MATESKAYEAAAVGYTPPPARRLHAVREPVDAAIAANDDATGALLDACDLIEDVQDGDT